MKFHGHDAWITCALRFKDRWREQWQPHRFTWLYFYDEAVSFAAGHRPCAECRFKRYKDYQSAWAQATGESPSAKAMNKQLHSERLVRGTHRRRLHSLPAGDLPDGVFVMLDDAPHVLVADAAIEWTRDGYATRRARPAGVVTAITPPSTIDVLRSGYEPHIHASAAT